MPFNIPRISQKSETVVALGRRERDIHAAPIVADVNFEVGFFGLFAHLFGPPGYE